MRAWARRVCPHELRVLLYAVQKQSDFGRAERLDALLLEQGHGLAALGGRLCRVYDGAKGGYLVDGVAVAVERALQGVQLGDVGARVGGLPARSRARRWRWSWILLGLGVLP